MRDCTATPVEVHDDWMRTFLEELLQVPGFEVVEQELCHGLQNAIFAKGAVQAKLDQCGCHNDIYME
jgi:hypothetical protein